MTQKISEFLALEDAVADLEDLIIEIRRDVHQIRTRINTLQNMDIDAEEDWG